MSATSSWFHDTPTPQEAKESPRTSVLSIAQKRVIFRRSATDKEPPKGYGVIGIVDEIESLSPQGCVQGDASNVIMLLSML